MLSPKRSARSSEYRRTKRKLLANVFITALVLCLCAGTYQYAGPFLFGGDSSEWRILGGRRLLSTCDASTPYKIPDSTYPSDAFTECQLLDGAVVLHTMGLLYMFLAIAIVCDEFFVPAIEVIVDRLALSPDVAGATFMAAGGSAPELFTAFLGTFFSSPDSGVGFSTIVGSAVFNVLFVIGCCAIFSSGDLVLTWYPFARDSVYYCCSLCVLAAFFYGDFIELYESMILLALYGGYVTLMFNNAKVYDFLDRKFIKTPESVRKETSNRMLAPPQAIQTFSVSLFSMLTADAKLSEIAGVHIVARMKGDIKATFKQVDTDNSGFIDKEELQAVLQKLGGKVTDEEVEACYSELDENADGKIDYNEFKAWYLRSETKIKKDVTALFKRFDHNGDGNISVSELEELVKACNGEGAEPPSSEDVDEARKMLDANNDGQISEEEFMNWYQSSKYFETKKANLEEVADREDKEEDEGISLEFPSSWKGRIWYLIVAPIMFSLYFTVPDVRKPRWTNWWPLAFIGSITWLGIYSFCMVWWATTIGNMAGIPDAIMGLTVLAAGTSVPDLLTSIIVAKAGNGDMAVSSSIGSNIFDILVGLPLPWFFATAASIQYNEYGYKLKISVVGDGIFISILILFGMIGAVLTIIYCSKWRMSRTLGYSMFVLYFLFCVQDILRNCDLGWSWC